MASVTPISGDGQAVLDKYLATQEAATAKKTSANANSDLSKTLSDYDTFLKLLTVQLQYQDPLAPTDPNEYTKQLTSFSQVEQSIKANDKLDELIKLQSAGGMNQYLGYLGKYAEIGSDKGLPLQDGKAQLGYKLADVAGSVDVIVKNKAGTEVARLSGETAVGNHVVSWDGKQGNTQLPDGLYTFEIVAKNVAGQDIKASNTTVIAKISALSTGTDGDLLFSLGDMVAGGDDLLSVLTDRPTS